MFVGGGMLDRGEMEERWRRDFGEMFGGRNVVICLRCWFAAFTLANIHFSKQSQLNIWGSAGFSGVCGF